MEHTNSPTRRGHLSKSLPLSVRFASGGGFRRRRRRKIKQALWENTRESLATLLVVLAHSSTVQKYLSVPAPTVAETPRPGQSVPFNQKDRFERGQQEGREVTTTRHASEDEHREKKTTPCAHRAAAYHPALCMSATTTVTRQLELTSKFYPPLHWLHATTTHRCGSCFKGPER